MDLASLLIFATAYALAVLSPGPGITALVARVIGRGTRGAPAYVAGFVVGDLIWFCVAALGLAALAKTWATLFLVVKWVGVAYLLYLAWKMWTAPAVGTDVAADTRDVAPRQLFLSGLLLTLGNPKVMAFFLALLPTIIDLSNLSLLAFAELFVLIAVILSTILSGYVMLASRARRFIASPAAMRVVNRACGVAIAGAAATVAVRA
jgi:threonine/homoserine/homoserine lactone efflux protein